MSDQVLDPAKIVGHEFPSFTRTYSERDVSLYALSVGASRDPMNAEELRFVYELHGDGLAVLPTFAVTFLSYQFLELPGVTYNPMMLLHGEHFLEVKRPLPTHATVTSKAKVAQVYDKGKGALVIVETSSTDAGGEEIAVNQSSIYIRGLGGFGGDRGPSSSGMNEPPNRPPDSIMEEETLPNQALLYRLASGDANPLHADPIMAAMGGFKQPILHGLCTFGFAARAVLQNFADNNPQRFKSIRVRFARHVFPGERLQTEMWQESHTRIIFRTKVIERDEYCITNAAVELQ